MDKEMSASFKMLTSVQHSATGLEEHLPFITDVDADYVLPCNPFLYLVGKMVDIDHSLVDAGRL